MPFATAAKIAPHPGKHEISSAAAARHAAKTFGKAEIPRPTQKFVKMTERIPFRVKQSLFLKFCIFGDQIIPKNHSW